MFVRFRQTARRLQVSLTAIRWDAGRVRHEPLTASRSGPSCTSGSKRSATVPNAGRSSPRSTPDTNVDDGGLSGRAARTGAGRRPVLGDDFIGAGMPATASPFSTRAKRSFAACAFAAVSAAGGPLSAIARSAVASSCLCPSTSLVLHLGNPRRSAEDLRYDRGSVAVLPARRRDRCGR